MIRKIFDCITPDEDPDALSSSIIHVYFPGWIIIWSITPARIYIRCSIDVSAERLQIINGDAQTADTFCCAGALLCVIILWHLVDLPRYDWVKASRARAHVLSGFSRGAMCAQWIYISLCTVHRPLCNGVPYTWRTGICIYYLAKYRCTHRLIPVSLAFGVCVCVLVMCSPALANNFISCQKCVKACAMRTSSVNESSSRDACATPGRQTTMESDVYAPHAHAL